MSRTMSAVTFAGFGSPEVLEITELPVPAPAPGEVLIRVAAAAVNPTDILMRSGKQAAMMTALTPPYIAGMEFSGHVAAPGDGVTDIAVGQPVIGVVNPRRQAGGAHTQYLCVPAASVAAIADHIDLVGAGAVAMNALTAQMALDMRGLKPGQAVLITGGAGALGGAAIQLGRRAGFKVVANAAEADWPLLARLGADICVPRGEGMADAIRTSLPDGVDGLIDGALIGNDVSHLVRAGGVAVSLRMAAPIHDDRLRTTYVSVIDGLQRGDILTAVAGHLAAGTLTARLADGGRFSFRDAVAANRMAEAGGFRGRVVLIFDDALAS